MSNKFFGHFNDFGFNNELYPLYIISTSYRNALQATPVHQTSRSQCKLTGQVLDNFHFHCQDSTCPLAVTPDSLMDRSGFEDISI